MTWSLASSSGETVPAWVAKQDQDCTSSACTVSAAPPFGTVPGFYPTSGAYVLTGRTASGAMVSTAGFTVNVVRAMGDPASTRPINAYQRDDGVATAQAPCSVGKCTAVANGVEALWKGTAGFVMGYTPGRAIYSVQLEYDRPVAPSLLRIVASNSQYGGSNYGGLVHVDVFEETSSRWHQVYVFDNNCNGCGANYFPSKDGSLTFNTGGDAVSRYWRVYMTSDNRNAYQNLNQFKLGANGQYPQ